MSILTPRLHLAHPIRPIHRAFTLTRTFAQSHRTAMPQPLHTSEVDSKTDPAVNKQWDTTTPLDEQISDFYKTVDSLKIGLLTTIRPGVGPVSRSMGVAKRRGPDFLFLANAHSQKFRDIEHDKTAQLTFRMRSLLV